MKSATLLQAHVERELHQRIATSDGPARAAYEECLNLIAARVGDLPDVPTAGQMLYHSSRQLRAGQEALQDSLDALDRGRWNGYHYALSVMHEVWAELVNAAPKFLTLEVVP